MFFTFLSVGIRIRIFCEYNMACSDKTRIHFYSELLHNTQRVQSPLLYERLFKSPTMKLTPLEQCENLLIEKLENMKSLGIINHSLCPHDRASEFEILEFYGDSVLYEVDSYSISCLKIRSSGYLLSLCKLDDL
jgi:hypothetical protein